MCMPTRMTWSMQNRYCVQWHPRTHHTHLTCTHLSASHIFTCASCGSMSNNPCFALVVRGAGSRLLSDHWR